MNAILSFCSAIEIGGVDVRWDRWRRPCKRSAGFSEFLLGVFMTPLTERKESFEVTDDIGRHRMREAIKEGKQREKRKETNQWWKDNTEMERGKNKKEIVWVDEYREPSREPSLPRAETNQERRNEKGKCCLLLQLVKQSKPCKPFFFFFDSASSRAPLPLWSSLLCVR